ncbi:type II secretion system F family protein [Variovorax sp. RHLX14]|uniref:type II secretion system F family protein n=1 Tax=Variovorax sp. RHLX14 TaxID=1259731 RepID=UPI003F475B5A
MTPEALAILSLALMAASALLVAGLLIARESERHRHARVLERALAVQGGAASSGTDGGDASGKSRKTLPIHWLQTRVGRLLVANEDRKLIDQCGLPSVRAQLVFLLLRLTLATLLPLMAWIGIAAGWLDQKIPPVAALAFIVGFMLPKWLLGRWAARRRERVVEELPLAVDLLRLLQGVGLSLDQSLQVMATDFTHVLKVLGAELVIANRQYAQGRTREQSMQRLATLHANDNLAGLVALLVQVDRHGGAVQEPLAQFGDRLRESRRSQMKARIGKITVKMTGIMVVTLLPALVIVAAGPGFLAIVRSMGAMGK